MERPPFYGMCPALQRLDARMAHYGIRITAIEEEEYCLIPMGGVLPRVPQRTLGIGGTAGMVHPSTGLAPLYPPDCSTTRDCIARTAQVCQPCVSMVRFY